jgi:plastocyanin
VNRGGAHTTTSGVGGGAYVKDGLWDSGFLAEGASFTRTFGQAGTFTYFCEIHPAQMQAQIVAEG